MNSKYRDNWKLCVEVLNCMGVSKTDKRVSLLDDISWVLC